MRQARASWSCGRPSWQARSGQRRHRNARRSLRHPGCLRGAVHQPHPRRRTRQRRAAARPRWSNYAAQVHVLGARIVPYPVDASTNWRLDPAVVEAAITPQTSALILNSPGNPTGVVFDPDDLAAVAELAAGRGVAVISDEAYDEVVFHTEPFSVASRVQSDQLLTIYSFSKTYAMTGWRIGYAVGRPTS